MGTVVKIRPFNPELTAPPRDWPPIDLGLENDQDDDANVEWANVILTAMGIGFFFGLVVVFAGLMWLSSMVVT